MELSLLRLEPATTSYNTSVDLIFYVCISSRWGILLSVIEYELPGLLWTYHLKLAMHNLFTQCDLQCYQCHAYQISENKNGYILLQRKCVYYMFPPDNILYGHVISTQNSKIFEHNE